MKLNIGVMFGGASVEHEISILTAMQVLQHLDKDKYTIIPIYCSKDSKYYQDDCLWHLEEYKDLDKLTKKLHPVGLYAKDQTCYIRSTSRFFPKEKTIDYVIPIFHGTNGEDGSIQGFLRMLGIPFCGSDVLGAAIGQDKVIMKELLEYHKVTISPWFSMHRFSYNYLDCQRQCASLGYPVIIKPANLGSSVGIHVVSSEEELDVAMHNAFLYDDKVVVEKVIVHMREFNCSVLGDQEETQVSCIEEVLKGDKILSYHDKYEGEIKHKGMLNTKRLLPAPINDEEEALIKDLAIKTFHTLQASGVVRIDFLMDDQSKCIYVNEINTIPGSLSFYLWKKQGLEFSELLNKVIDLGIKRQRRRASMIFSYTTNVLSSYQGGNKQMK